MSQDILTKEERAAWRLAYLATASTTSDLVKFSGWLMTGLGAALTFFIANHESVTYIIEWSNIRASIFIFAASMLSGLLVQWLNQFTKAGLAFSDVSLELRGQEMDPLKFLKAFSSLLIFPFSCLFSHRVIRAKETDNLQAIRSPAKTSQIQSLLVLLQFLLAVAVVLTIALGLKV